MTSVKYNEKPRVAHSRFFNNRPLFKLPWGNNDMKYDRVVTSAWVFDSENQILTYAATVYQKKHNKDFWVKKVHCEEALARFDKCPLRIHLVGDVGEVSGHAMDWFISTTLIFRFGCYNKKDVDVRRIHGEVFLKDNFMETFDPYYKEFKNWELEKIDDYNELYRTSSNSDRCEMVLFSALGTALGLVSIVTLAYILI